jgi:hypothetical protein
VRRVALIITLTSVGILAVAAIFALVGGAMGDTEWKIVITSLLVTAAAAVALGCAVPIHDGRLGWLPYLGIAASAGGFGLLILGIWAEETWDAALKLAVSFVILSVAIAMVGLVDAARVHRRHRSVVVASQGLTGLGGAMLIAAVWGEIGNDLFWRATAVVLVLTAAVAVAVPILHKLAGIPPHSDRAHERMIEHCPYCGAPTHGPHATRLVCDSCGESFRVLH